MDEKPRDRLESDDQPTVPSQAINPPTGARAPLPEFLDPMASSLYPGLPGPPPPPEDQTGPYGPLAIAVGALPKPKPRPQTVLGVVGVVVAATLVFIGFFTVLGGRHGFFGGLFALAPRPSSSSTLPQPGGGLVSPQATSGAHTPVAIPTVAPTAGPSPTVIASPSPTQTVLTVAFTCPSYPQTYAQAQVCVQTMPNAALTIKVVDCDSRQDSNAKPANTFADNSGAYTWKWAPRHPHGCNTATVTITATVFGQSPVTNSTKLTFS